MRSEWRTYTLQELCNIKYGKDHKALEGGIIPVYGSGGIMRYVAKAIYTSPSVLIPRKGTLSNLFYIDEPFWTVDTLFYTEIFEEKILPRYLFYVLKSMNLENMNVGTAVPSLTIAVLNEISLKLPPLPEQRAIAATLSCLDEKIELNNKINANLEAQAQAIFKSWFVDFEPFQDGEFVDSELGMIPKGWRTGIVGDFSKDIVCGKTPSTKRKENYGNNVPFITIPDMHGNVYIIKTARLLSCTGANTQHKKMVPANSICVSCIATTGLVALVSESSQTNQQINTIVSSDDMSYIYVYFYMKMLSRQITTLASSGSATPNLNKKQFSKMAVLIPPNKLIMKFHERIHAAFEAIKDNQFESRTLAALRDALLPKLMSGEIEVPAAEALIQERS